MVQIMNKHQSTASAPQKRKVDPTFVLIVSLFLAIPGALFIGWQMAVSAMSSEVTTNVKLREEALRLSGEAEARANLAERRNSELNEQFKSTQDNAAILKSQIGGLTERINHQETDINRLNSRRAKLVLRGNSHTITRYAPVDLPDVSVLSSDQDPNWRFVKSDRIEGASLVFE